MFRIFFGIFSMLSIFYVAMPSKEVESSESSDIKYVSYLTHSGLNNQRIALENAIITAYLLNRTLIIPPLFIGKAVPWKPYSHLKSLLIQRVQQIQSTRRKCIKEVEHKLDIGNATEIRDQLYIACRKPTREIAKWSDFVDFSFLEKLNVTYIEMAATEYPNFNMSDTTIIKDDDLYSYKLFDTDLDMVHNLQFDYFDITTFKENEIFHQQPTIKAAVPMSEELKEMYMGKYKIPLEISFLSKFNQTLVQFGSLFGSSRLCLLNKKNLKIQKFVQQSLIFNNPLIAEITDTMREKLGQYVSIHYRSTEAGFILHKVDFMKNLHKELRTFVSLYLQHHNSHLPGILYSNQTISISDIFSDQKSGNYDHFKFKEMEDVVDNVDTIPSLESVTKEQSSDKRMAMCKKHQKGWLHQLQQTLNLDKKLDDDPIYDKQVIKKLPKTLPLVLFIATDVSNPQRDRFLNNLSRKFPCTFYLNDFKATQMLQTDPIMINEINLQLGKATVDQKYGELLSFGKGNLYFAFIDQVMAGNGVAFFGTEMSTFSQMSLNVYAKECQNEFYAPLDLIKGYTINQLWVKNRRRIGTKLLETELATKMGIKNEKLLAWLKYVPQELQLHLIWKFVGCGYTKML